MSDFGALSEMQVMLLSETDFLKWKTWKTQNLLKPYKGPERIKRKKWAREIVRKVQKRRDELK